MRKSLTIIAIALLNVCAAQAQPAYDYGQLQMERLNRGVVAVPMADGRVMVSWRTLRDDPRHLPFNVYRNGEQLNTKTLRDGGTCFIDEHPLSPEADVLYTVAPLPTEETLLPGQMAQLPVPLQEGAAFTLKAHAPVGYLPLPLQKPEGGMAPDGRPYRYSANDATAADVDGDGQYEIILKWDPSNAHDNAHAGFTGPTLFDCYRLDGTLLWRIDMGPNIRSGAHYVPFIAYDLDGDGRAELMVRTAVTPPPTIVRRTTDARWGASLAGRSSSPCSTASRDARCAPSPTSQPGASRRTGATTMPTAPTVSSPPWAIWTADGPAPSSAAATTHAPSSPHGTGTDTS